MRVMIGKSKVYNDNFFKNSIIDIKKKLMTK